MSVAAIVLAAGASRRLGQPKQLLVHRGETLLSRSIRLAKESGALPVFVVLGARFRDIIATVSFEHTHVIQNEIWEQGMSASLHAGLHAVEANAPETRGVLILPCDQPRLTAEHLGDLIHAFEKRDATAIAASMYSGIRGIPAVFPRAVFPSLYAIEGDKGARSLLSHPTCPIVVVDFPDGQTDIDLPTDLTQLE